VRHVKLDPRAGAATVTGTVRAVAAEARQQGKSFSVTDGLAKRASIVCRFLVCSGYPAERLLKTPKEPLGRFGDLVARLAGALGFFRGELARGIAADNG
jgi:hypothetical protein